MENYIVINGKKAELTEEQLKALGIDTPKKDPFARVEEGEIFYYIMGDGEVKRFYDEKSEVDNRCFNSANYCTDKDLADQRNLHEILNRRLWRYSMQHAGDAVRWHCKSTLRKANYRIFYDHYTKNFDVAGNDIHQDVCAVYFAERKIAEAAIEEIVKPFLKEHPDFKW